MKLFVVPRLKSRSLAFISRVPAPRNYFYLQVACLFQALLSRDPIASGDLSVRSPICVRPRD